MNVTSGRYNDLEIKQTEAASTRVHIINNNHNDDVNHNMQRLLNIDIKSNDIPWKARHLMFMYQVTIQHCYNAMNVCYYLMQ